MLTAGGKASLFAESQSPPPGSSGSCPAKGAGAEVGRKAAPAPGLTVYGPLMKYREEDH